MAPNIKNIVRKFILALQKEGFPSFRAIIFGSYARNEARRDSDIDVCLVSNSFKHNREKYRREATIIAYGIDPRIQVVAVEPQLIKAGHLSPLYSQIRKEGLLV